MQSCSYNGSESTEIYFDHTLEQNYQNVDSKSCAKVADKYKTLIKQFSWLYFIS